MSENGNMDKMFIAEIKALLADFEITRTKFIDHVISLEEWNNDMQKCQLEKGNMYQYFRDARPIPLSKLWRIIYYLLDYKSEISDKQQAELFYERVDCLAGKVVDYIIMQSNTPMEFRKQVKATLEEMKDQDIVKLFDSLQIFSVSENVWNFWACYCCLDCEAQKKIRELLSGYPLSPKAYGVNFYSYRLWDSDVNRPTCVKFKKIQAKYSKTEEDVADRKKYISEIAALLYDFPYHFRNVAQNFFQRATAPAEMTVDDWSIIIAYGLLQSAVTSESDITDHVTIDGKVVSVDRELLKIDKAILALLSDKTNWLRNQNGKGEYTTVPEKFVEYYMEAFRKSSTADWL